jgi:prolyl-tRNA editing enzyme YbaK/EbsC (Cys-tRNA(Pro) deacylase)
MPASLRHVAVDFSAFAAVLRSLGVAGSVRELPSRAPTAATAAAQLGCDVAAIANSLVFDADGEPVLVMTSGAHRVATGKVAALVRAAAVRRADPDSVRRWTGQPIGGVAPVGHPAPIRTLVDTWLEKYDVIWAAGGHPHTVFPTSFAELVRITNGTPCDVGELSRFTPAQRITPHQVTTVADAGEDAGRDGPDLAPGHARVGDRDAIWAALPAGQPVGQHERKACRAREHVDG